MPRTGRKAKKRGISRQQKKNAWKRYWTTWASLFIRKVLAQDVTNASQDYSASLNAQARTRNRKKTYRVYATAKTTPSEKKRRVNILARDLMSWPALGLRMRRKHWPSTGDEKHQRPAHGVILGGYHSITWLFETQWLMQGVARHGRNMTNIRWLTAPKKKSVDI